MMTVPAGEPGLQQQWQLEMTDSAMSDAPAASHEADDAELQECWNRKRLQKPWPWKLAEPGHRLRKPLPPSDKFVASDSTLARPTVAVSFVADHILRRTVLISQHLARAPGSSCLQLNWTSSLARKEKESRFGKAKNAYQMSGHCRKLLLVMTSSPCSRARAKANHRENPPSMHIACWIAPFWSFMQFFLMSVVILLLRTNRME